MKISTLRLKIAAFLSIKSLQKKLPTAFAARLLIMVVLCLGAGKGWTQPWTYDFGTGTGSNTSASSGVTTFFSTNTSATPSGGGTYRIRTGTTPGTGFILANPGTSLGTTTELQINASTTTSTNKFTIYSWTAPATVAYLKCNLRTTSSGTGGLTIQLGDATTTGTDNQGYTSGYNAAISTLILSYSSGVLTVSRRINGSTVTISSSGFTKDGNQAVEMYANNGASSTSYTRSGSNSLNSQSWDLWVDGTKISPSGGWATSGTWGSGNSISGIGFFAESSSSNLAFMYMDDLEYSNALPSSTPTLTPTPSSITGLTYVEGSGPSTASSFTLAGSNLTAGGGTITISESTDYEVSTTNSTTGFGASATLTYTGTGTISPNTVWVRLKAGRTAGTYNSQTLNISGGGASTSVTVSGTVTSPPPANDNCSGAVAITCGGSVTVNNSNATDDALPTPSCSGASATNGLTKGIWFTVTPTASGSVTISTCPSATNIDTYIRVFTGSCGSFTSCLGFNDDNAACTSKGATSLITFTATANTTYYILCGLYDAAKSPGAITISATCPLPICSTPTSAPSNLTFNTQSSTSISGSFDKSTIEPSGGYLVVQRTSATLSPNPSDGTNYAVSASVGGGTVAANITANGSASYSFTSNGTLASNTQYYFFVIPYNFQSGICNYAYGNGASISNSTYTCPAAPATPTVGTITSTTAVINWISPGGSGAITSYDLQWRLSPAGSFTVISNVTSPYTLNVPLSPGTVYDVQVRASNAVCTGAYSSSLTFTTSAIDAPVATAATSIGATNFTANWGSVSGATSYFLDVSTSSTFIDPINTTVVGWDFEASTTTASSSIPANSTKTITTVGGTSAITFTSENGGLTARAATWNSGSGSKYWEAANISTTGYYNIKVSSKQRSSSTGPRDFKLQYKIGVGGSYTDVTGGVITTADNYTTGVLNAVALPAICENQSSVYLRWIMTSNTSVGNGTVASGGGSNIDDIIVAGNAPLFVSGYNNLSVAGTSQSVTGLTANTNYHYRVRSTNGSSTSSNSNPISVLTIQNPATTNYRSISSGDFNTASTWEYNDVGTNYTTASQAPGPDNSITIQTGHAVNLTANQTLNSALHINTTGSLVIGSNTLTLNGTVTGSGTLSGSSTSNLVIDGTAGTLNFTSGSRILKDLTLNASATATLGSPLEITAGASPLTSGTVIINSGATFASAGNLTIKSNEFGTARVGNSAGTITGNVTVERFIKLRTPGTGTGTGNNGRAYRLLAPTVNTSGSIRDNWMETGLNTVIGSNDNPLALHGTQITGTGGNANGFDVTASNAPSLYSTTNAVTPTYTDNGSTNGTLNALTGYFLYIRGDRSMDMTIPLAPGMPTSSTTLRTKGTLLTGNQSFTSTLSTGDGIMNLVANPYASPISWNSIFTDVSATPTTNLKNYYTLWDPNVGTRGGFVTVTDGGGVSILNGQTGPSLANINIQPGQAFFVTSDGASAPTLTIKESHKSAVNNNNVFLVPPESFSVNLFFNEPNSYRRIADGVSVFYDNTYTPGIDGSDALEINNWDENIAIARAGKHLAIEGRPVILTRDTLPLFMNNMKEQPYEFEFTPAQFTNIGLKAELVDNFTNTRSLLSVVNATVVPFTVTADPASKATNRFMVVFGPQAPLAIDVLTISAQVKYQPAAQGGNWVQVNWMARTEKDMDRYELERSFSGTSFNRINTMAAIGNSPVAVNYSWLDVNPQTGLNFYRIKAIDKSGLVKYTSVVKVSFGKANPAITVSPNPVSGNTIYLHFTDIEKGTYSLVVINNLGQRVYSTQLQHAGGSATIPVTPDNALAKGVYEVVLAGEKIRITNRMIKN